MVVFLDLEDESEPPEHYRYHAHHAHAHLTTSAARWSNFEASTKSMNPFRRGNEVGVASLVLALARGVDGTGEVRENPNRNKMTEALGCYP